MGKKPTLEKPKGGVLDATAPVSTVSTVKIASPGRKPKIRRIPKA